MRRIALLSTAVLLAACSPEFTPPASPAGLVAKANGTATASVDLCLTLLHNNDGESKIVNVGPGLEAYGGIARFATIVQRERAAANGRGATTPCGSTGARGSLLVSSGDNYLAGSQLNASLQGPIFYDAVGLDLIGYDALAIGNHEFDFGPDVFARFVNSFTRTRPPFISANLDVSADPTLAVLAASSRIVPSAAFALPQRTRLTDYSTIVTVAQRKVGIIGATTPLLPAISSPGRVVAQLNVAGLVNAEVDRLLTAGVTRIIFISHLQSLQEDLALVPQLRGVDVVVTGGGEELLGPVGGLYLPGDVPSGNYPRVATDVNGRTVRLITTRGDYAYLGRLVVGFDAAGEIVHVATQSGPIRVSSVAPDAVAENPAVKALVTDPVAAYDAASAARIVASSLVPLDGIRNNVRTAETNLGNLTADALLWQSRQRAVIVGAPLPQVGLQNAGGIRNGTLLPVGNISEKNTFDILPFSNFVSIVPNIPATQFKEILENAVSRVSFIDGRFLQVAGFTFEWQVSGTPQIVTNAGLVTTPGTRIRTVTLNDGTVLVQNGAVVSGASPVDIATIDFLAKGGDQSPYRGAPFTSIGIVYQLGLQNYLTAPTSIGGLGGTVTSTQYPAGGSGRITRIP